MSADLMSSFQASGAMLGSLSAIYFYSYALMQLPAGALVDFWGVRKTVTAGNVVAGLGSIMFGLAPLFWMAGVGRFFVGLGVSVIFVGIMKSNSLWYSERYYGILTGFTVFLGNLGSIMAAGPLSALLNVLSWRILFILIGAASILLAGLSFYIVRNRPDDYGHPPILLPEPLEPVSPVSTSAKALFGEVSRRMLRVLSNRGLWISSFLSFAASGGVYTFMGLWGMPYLRDVHGLTRDQGSIYITVMISGFAIGSLAWGWLSDYIGRRKEVLTISLLLYNLMWIALVFLNQVGNLWSILLFFLFGATGCGFILTLSNAKELCDTEDAGMAVATVNTGGFLGVALVQPFFGRLLDTRWDNTINEGVRIYSETAYHYAFYWMLGLGVVALLISFFLKEREAEGRGRDR